MRWRDSATFLRIKKLDVPLLYYHCWLVSSFAIKDVCSHINAMPRESQFNFAGNPSLHLFDPNTPKPGTVKKSHFLKKYRRLAGVELLSDRVEFIASNHCPSLMVDGRNRRQVYQPTLLVTLDTSIKGLGPPFGT